MTSVRTFARTLALVATLAAVGIGAAPSTAAAPVGGDPGPGTVICTPSWGSVVLPICV